MTSRPNTLKDFTPHGILRLHGIKTPRKMPEVVVAAIAKTLRKCALPDAPICNWCGGSCRSDADKGGMAFNDMGLLDASVNGGFDSTAGSGQGALDDGESYTFSLCEFCLDFMFSQFRVPPEVTDYIKGDDSNFIPAKRRVEEDDWRPRKAEFFAEYSRRSRMRNGEP